MAVMEQNKGLYYMGIDWASPDTIKWWKVQGISAMMKSSLAYSHRFRDLEMWQ